MRKPELDAPSLQSIEGHLQTSMEVWVDNNNSHELIDGLVHESRIYSPIAVGLRAVTVSRPTAGKKLSQNI